MQGSWMQEDNTAIRKYIRHITGVPIEVSLDYTPVNIVDSEDDTITNVSLGGLSFIANDRLDIDNHIEVRFPILSKDSVLGGKVVWCEKTARGYEVGLEFDDPEELDRLKMVEHICHIENYKKEIENREGRQLNSEQAAHEWISRFAGDFSAT